MPRSFYLAGVARMLHISQTTELQGVRERALEQGKQYLLLATFTTN